MTCAFLPHDIKLTSYKFDSQLILFYNNNKNNSWSKLETCKVLFFFFSHVIDQMSSRIWRTVWYVGRYNQIEQFHDYLCTSKISLLVMLMVVRSYYHLSRDSIVQTLKYQSRTLVNNGKHVTKLIIMLSKLPRSTFDSGWSRFGLMPSCRALPFVSCLILAKAKGATYDKVRSWKLEVSSPYWWHFVHPCEINIECLVLFWLQLRRSPLVLCLVIRGTLSIWGCDSCYYCPCCSWYLQVQ